MTADRKVVPFQTRYMAELGHRLLDRGYNVIPIKRGTKEPNINDWQNIRTTDNDIIKWKNGREKNDGIGFTTAYTPAIDVDVLDKEFVKAYVNEIEFKLGFAPERIGKAPKSLLLYRTEIPFRKVTSAEYADSEGRKAQVEILCKGQQFVAYAVHPNTHKPYEWSAGHNPLKVRADALPVLTVEGARWAVELFEQMADARGWQRGQRSVSKRAMEPSGDDGELGDSGEPLGLTDEELRSYVMAVPNDNAEEDDWFKMLAGIRHETRESAAGCTIAREWSMLSYKHDDKRFDYRWTHFNEEYKGRPITARYIIHLAKQHGWTKEGPIDPSKLRLAAWLDRDIPPPDFLLSEFLSTTTRAELIGPTGLGKTNFSMAIAFAIALGDGFLHWKGCGKPRRVLVIDGEMSRRLMQRRLRDLVRRNGGTIMPDSLYVLSREDFENMPPLNTKDGQNFIDRVIEETGGVDLVIFDNVESLTDGDMNDPLSWKPVLPWTRDLTRREIGQLWVHHTGHDETHGYGSKTREWGLDLVMLMERVEQPDADIAFQTRYVKARERTPDNRADFDPVTITLSDDQWACEPIAATVQPVAPKPFTPAQQAALKALDALIASGDNTETKWREACIDGRDVSNAPERSNRKRQFNKVRGELFERGMIKVSDDKVYRKDDVFEE